MKKRDRKSFSAGVGDNKNAKRQRQGQGARKRAPRASSPQRQEREFTKQVEQIPSIMPPREGNNERMKKYDAEIDPYKLLDNILAQVKTCGDAYIRRIYENNERMKKYAVLIDAENISYKLLGDIVAHVKTFGDASIRRIYGNFEDQRMNQWKIAAAAHDFHPTQPFSFTGKQFADFALTIDAIDILHGDECPDGFVIVSSDSDFTGLVQRLRTSKKHVIGIGCQGNSSEQLKKACDEYILIENINSGAPEEPQYKKMFGGDAPVHTLTTCRQLELMTKAIQKCVADKDGFVNLSCVDTQLKLLTPGGIDELSNRFGRHPELFEKETIGSATFVALVSEMWEWEGSCD